jgi:hypothetical protein
MFKNSWTTLIWAAGAAQILLVAVSLALIPRILRWREETARLRPLTRQVATTYAFYVVTTNLAFGVLSALRPGWLVGPPGLATAVDAFIALWWGVRLVLQFTYYDRHGGPSGPAFRLAEIALVTLFAYLTLVYGAAAFATVV